MAVAAVVLTMLVVAYNLVELLGSATWLQYALFLRCTGYGGGFYRSYMPNRFTPAYYEWPFGAPPRSIYACGGWRVATTRKSVPYRRCSD